jgi:HK97 gp10 family phage protein
MATTVEVKGLRECLKNMKALGELVQTKITREALREQAWVVAQASRRATYKNFVRRTGAIRSGVGVIVQKDPKDQKLKAYATEYPQSIAGAATPFTSLVRKRLSRKRRRATPTAYVAVWWRWLEFGTGPRRAASTPKWINKKPTRSDKVRARQAKRLAAFNASPSRGAITARNFMRPAFHASAEQSIREFRKDVLEGIERETDAMTK